MIEAYRHTGLVVDDLPAALYFWSEVMGFSIVRQMEESGREIDAILDLRGVQVTTVKMAAPDGTLLELLKFHSHPDKPAWEGKPYSTGITHIAFTVRSMSEAVERLGRAGVIFPNAPQRSPDGKVIVTYARGPEGLILELVEQLS